MPLPRRVLRRLLIALSWGLSGSAMVGCATTGATTGATFRSGVGDAFLEHPPYYAGNTREATSRDTTHIGHLPIAFQRGASQPSIFDPRDGSGSAIDRLLEAMNAYLDSLGVSTRLAEGRRVSAVAHAATQHPPDVRFGCTPRLDIPGEDCAERGDSALGRGHQTMQLAVGRPSKPGPYHEAGPATTCPVATRPSGMPLTGPNGRLRSSSPCTRVERAKRGWVVSLVAGVARRRAWSPSASACSRSAIVCSSCWRSCWRVAVAVRANHITITTRTSALAGALRPHIHKMQQLCGTGKRLTIRIG